jgi:uncharacterized membrane protein
MSSRRFISIDMMRALAIAGMVLCHFVITWSSPEINPLLYFVGDHVLGDWPAAFFTFLVGVSLAISIARREDKGEDKEENRLRGIKRGLFVFAVGLLLAVCISGPASIFDWDILTLSGTALILLQLIRDVRPAWIASGCVVIVLVTPYFQQAAGFLTYWGGAIQADPVIGSLVPKILYSPVGTYAPGFGMDAVTGYLFTGYFPVFPWIIFPILGFLTGKILFTDRLAISATWKFPAVPGFLLIGAGLVIGYLGSLSPQPVVTGAIIAPFSFYPETMAMLLLQLGLTFLVLELLRKLFDHDHALAPWERIPERLSRYSLSLYIIHLLVLNVPLELQAYLYPGSTPFMAAWSPLTGLVLGILFLAGFTLITGWWDRIGGRYSFEWIMAKVIGD